LLKKPLDARAIARRALLAVAKDFGLTLKD
jgi:hypothetical protein